MTSRRRSRLATSAVIAALLLCEFSFAFQVLTGAKVAYFIALALLVATAATCGRVSRPFMLALAAGVGVSALVALQWASGVRLANGWESAAIAYVAFPVVLLGLDLRRIDLEAVWWALALTAVPAVVGLVVQAAGGESPLLARELTSTLSVVHVRYNSVFGVSLLLGMCGAVQVACVLLLLPREQRRWRRALLVALGLAALACVVFSYARRAYLTAGAGIVLSAFAQARRARAALVVVSIAFLFAASVFSDSSPLTRLRSSVDFAVDEGNALRAAKWALATTVIEHHPLLGGGPGVLSSVGKSREELGAAEEAQVAEMLYLAILADLGVVAGGAVILALLLGSFDRLSRSPHQRLLAAPIAIEGIAGLSAFNPFVLCVLLLAISKAHQVELVAPPTTTTPEPIDTEVVPCTSP